MLLKRCGSEPKHLSNESYNWKLMVVDGQAWRGQAVEEFNALILTINLTVIQLLEQL